MLNGQENTLLSGFIRIQTDIRQYPGKHKNYVAVPGSKVVKGDMHGNALTFLFLAVLHGYIEISQKDYDELARIFPKRFTPTWDSQSLSVKFLPGSSTPTRKDVRKCKEILARVIIPEAAKGSLLLLLGDLTADRTTNDLWTLLLLQKVKGIAEILISNHDVDLVKASERKTPAEKLNHKYANVDLEYGHGSSLVQLGVLISHGIITEQEVDELIATVYRPALKALSYTLSKDKKEITIETHGAVDFDIIELLAKHPDINVPYNDNTAEELAATIDAINEKFRQLACKGDLSKLFPSTAVERAYRGVCNKNIDPFIYLVWNRIYYSGPTNFPAEHKGYKTNACYGHDGVTAKYENKLCCNNTLGGREDSFEGEYVALYVSPQQCCQPRLGWAEQLKQESKTSVFPTGNPAVDQLSKRAGANAAQAKKNTWIIRHAGEIIISILALSLILVAAAGLSFFPPLGFLAFVGLSALPAPAVFGILSAIGVGAFMIGVGIYATIRHNFSKLPPEERSDKSIELGTAPLLKADGESMAEQENCFGFKGWFLCCNDKSEQSSSSSNKATGMYTQKARIQRAAL